MIVEAIRLLTILVFTVIGVQLAPDLMNAADEGAVENARLIGAIVGAGVGYVLGGILGRWFKSGITAAPHKVQHCKLSAEHLFKFTCGAGVGQREAFQATSNHLAGRLG